MPLEGLWWADDMTEFSAERKHEWKWRMMIAIPDIATEALVAELVPAVTAEKQLVAGARVRFEIYDEGDSAQIMHLGPYADEAPTVELLHDFIAAEGLQRRGLHHEIYLGDPRRSDPAKLKTIIRQPVA